MVECIDRSSTIGEDTEHGTFVSLCQVQQTGPSLLPFSHAFSFMWLCSCMHPFIVWLPVMHEHLNSIRFSIQVPLNVISWIFCEYVSQFCKHFPNMTAPFIKYASPHAHNPCVTLTLRQHLEQMRLCFQCVCFCTLNEQTHFSLVLSWLNFNKIVYADGVTIFKLSR